MSNRRLNWFGRGVALVWALAAWSGEAASPVVVPLVDFTRPNHGWQALNHTKDPQTTANGFSFAVTDEDPWLVGPEFNFPAIPPNAAFVKFTATCAPTTRADAWQLFFACKGEPFNEGKTVRMKPLGKAPYTTFAGELPVNLVASGPVRLRVDPPNYQGGKPSTFTIQSLKAEYLMPLFQLTPQTPPPLVIPASTKLVLDGVNWELRHDPDRFGAFRVILNGKMVENDPDLAISYCDASGETRKLDFNAAKMTATDPSAREFSTSVSARDADGRNWTLTRRFLSVENGQALTISTTVAPERPAEILHVPFLTLFVDRNSSGHKRQAMLAGVEYLEDEPSSNQKEVRSHEYDRTIPAEYRLSAPLAVFTDDLHWLGLGWDSFARGVEFRRPAGPAPFATVFDSPDRIFKSGGHLLAFWAPAVGEARRESKRSIFAVTPFSTSTHSITLRSGKGNDVATALKELVRFRDLPQPDAIVRRDALELLARGWLDSSIRKGTRVRHACTQNFPYSLAGDAPYLMQYLASMLTRTEPASTALPPRLREVSNAMLAELKSQQIGRSTISHIRRPAPVLVGGDLTNHLNRCAADLKALNRNNATGKRIWHAPPDRANLGETLGADHCNGYTAIELEHTLAVASWSGDEAEIAKALAIVDKVTERYHGTVPRGAQPWEMPLHTPDIMASAHLMRSYTLAYMLKPDPAYLREANHWADTGLSMIYFVPPPRAFPAGVVPVGRYATCAVMGATHWFQPNWIGRPVQWCGLVYAAALWDLARLDPVRGAYWKKIAEGITTSGMRQTHTAEEPDNVGLLPDSWNLMDQDRFFCPINPGTVEEPLSEYLGLPFYSLRSACPKKGEARTVLIHAAGKLTVSATTAGTIDVQVDLWPETPSRVVLTRLAKPASVSFGGLEVPFAYLPERRALIVVLPARAQGQLRVKE